MVDQDSFEFYVEDMLSVGVGMVDVDVVCMVICEVCDYILDLIMFGILFDCIEDGGYVLFCEVVYFYVWVVCVKGDQVGVEIMVVLIEEVCEMLLI